VNSEPAAHAALRRGDIGMVFRPIGSRLSTEYFSDRAHRKYSYRDCDSERPTAEPTRRY
jgi:hypothetical protein